MSKYHVTNDGAVRICKANKGRCPFKEHFDTKENAENFIQKEMEREFNILPSIVKDKESSVEDKVKAIKNIRTQIKKSEAVNENTEYMKRTKLAESLTKIREELPHVDRYSYSAEEVGFDKHKGMGEYAQDKSSQYHLVQYSKAIDSIDIKTQETFHITVERRARIETMNNYFGEGNPIQYLEISQTEDRRANVKKEDKKFEKLFVEIRDNGRLIFYGDNGNTITTFISSPSRMDIYMKMANLVPSDEFMRQVRLNHVISRILRLKHRDDEVENKKRRKKHKIKMKRKRERIRKQRNSKNKQNNKKIQQDDETKTNDFVPSWKHMS